MILGPVFFKHPVLVLRIMRARIVYDIHADFSWLINFLIFLFLKSFKIVNIAYVNRQMNWMTEFEQELQYHGCAIYF